MPSAVSYRLGTDSNVIFIPEQNRLIIEEENHNEERHLEPLQARMLSFFIQHQGEVQNARTIAEAVWDRSQVSDNLVRQVISQLRSQLNDKERPYSIIKTIPKQGYLFDREVIEQEIPNRTPSDSLPDNLLGNLQENTPEKSLKDPALTSSQPYPPKAKTNTVKTTQPMKHLMIFSIIIAVILTISTGITYFSKSNNAGINQTASENNKITPVIFHDIELDQNKDLTVARNVYNYLFFGLNSSNNIVGYHYSQLTPAARKQLTPDAISLKGWIKETKKGYHLKLLIDIPSHSGEIKKLDVTFTKDNFFSAIGDLVLSLKATISPTTSDYSFANHRVTSVENYNDWQAISKGISLFYQGKGAESFKGLSSELEMIKRQGRDNYLLEALFSYISSMNSLNTSSSEDKRLALSYAKEAFEKNPRCNIANISLGLALIVNNQSEQAYPYLFYAAENSPSPLSYYLLSIADQQANNPKGAEYNYQRFNRLSKGQKSQLAELKASLQKSNLFPTAKQVD